MLAWYHAGLRHAAHPRLVLAAALLAGCGAGASADYLPGASSAARGGGRGAPAAATATARPMARWKPFDTVRRWPTLGGAPVVARDHAGGRYLGKVRVSPGARQAYESLTRGSEVPAGSVVAMFHEDARTHAPGPVYVMQKQAAGWLYLVLTPDGHIRARGALRLCGRCHAEATADHLFGDPR